MEFPVRESHPLTVQVSADAQALSFPQLRHYRRGSGRIEKGRVAPVSAIHPAHLEPARPDIAAGGVVGIV